jgi:hypothetical protein
MKKLLPGQAFKKIKYYFLKKEDIKVKAVFLPDNIFFQLQHKI